MVKFLLGVVLTCALMLCSLVQSDGISNAATTTTAANLVSHAAAVAIRLAAHREECAYEEVASTGTKVYVHFLVTSGGAMDVDVTIYTPDNQIVWQAERSKESRVLFKARVAGTYRFCFSNKMSTITAKVVAFNILVGDPADVTSKTHQVDPMERSLVRISQGLQEIKNEQNYLRTRERIHRDTTESTNTRVLLMSVGEIAVIVLLGIGHVWYLRRLFESRRAV